MRVSCFVLRASCFVLRASCFVFRVGSASASACAALQTVRSVDHKIFLIFVFRKLKFSRARRLKVGEVQCDSASHLLAQCRLRKSDKMFIREDHVENRIQKCTICEVSLTHLLLFAV